MDGATAPRRRGTALWLLDGEGRCDGSLTARGGVWRLLDGKGGRRERGGGWTESTTAMGGDGRRDGKLTVMDGTALRRDGNSTARNGTMVT